MLRRTVLTAAFVLVAATGMAQEHPVTIHVHDAYARFSATGGGSGAVFFLLHNNGEADDRLIGARAELAGMAELHTNVESADGLMQMVAIEAGVPLPAGAMHDFARGGDHVMLMGVTEAPAEGASFPLTLVFETAGEVVVEVVVDSARKPDAAGALDHSHGADGGKDSGTGG